MKKFRYFFTIFLLTVFTLSACGKEKDTKTNAYSSNQDNTDLITATVTDANSPIVNINNIVAKVGDTIDYMASIQSVENMELEKSMIYIDSSAVDTSTPGVYAATYTFDYMGTVINRMITVTIEALENLESSSGEENSTTNVESSSMEESSSGESSQENTESNSSTPDNADTSDTTAQATSSAGTENITTPYDVTLDAQDIPDASITLSNGTIVTIKCTPNRYIVETFTDETYYDENGFTYLKSELKVAFNTGDVQVVETVITRVASNPNQE